MMKTLAIETSCDDTSLAIVSEEGGNFVVEDILAYSQIQEHQQFGGVVPELASRLHSEKVIAILQRLGLERIQEVDFISVTTEPGLPGSLVVGKTVASLLGEFYQKEVVLVYHIWGHVFSILLERNIEELRLPLVILTASGGHNDIYLVEEQSAKMEIKSDFPFWNYSKYRITKLGWTLDDAAGECFDKVSRMLGGPYPGGAWIAEKARLGKPNPLVKFKRIFLAHEKYEFSFSGMKSQVSFLLEKLKKDGIPLTEELICDIAYDFQEAVVEVLAKKLVQAAEEYGAQTLGLAGGVSANERISEVIRELLEKKRLAIPFFSPVKKLYSTDNGAMIGAAGLLAKR